MRNARWPNLAPARLLHDMSGRLIVEGEVEPGRGSAIWRCASVAAGSYIISAFDGNDVLIATMEVIKQ